MKFVNLTGGMNWPTVPPLDALNVRLEGDNARLDANGILLATGRRHLDTRVAVEHEAFGVQGTQTVRYGVGTAWVTKTVNGGGAWTTGAPSAAASATPDALRAHLKSEIEKWAPIIKKAGVYAD